MIAAFFLQSIAFPPEFCYNKGAFKFNYQQIGDIGIGVPFLFLFVGNLNANN